MNSGLQVGLYKSQHFSPSSDFYVYYNVTLQLPAQYFYTTSGVYGSVPQVIVDEEDDIVQKLHARSSELDSLKQVADNAQKQYVRSRGQSSPESVKRAKQLPQSVPMHPIFQQFCSEHELETTHLLDCLKTYKPSQVPK